MFDQSSDCSFFRTEAGKRSTNVRFLGELADIGSVSDRLVRRSPFLARKGKPFLETHIHTLRKTTRCEHNGPIDAQTNAVQYHRTALGHSLTNFTATSPFKHYF
jgi:hypothetical protein